MEEKMTCETLHHHEKLIASAMSKMPDEACLYDLAELFKIFGDSTRMKILFALYESQMCVCDLTESLNMTQSAVSHQLQILRKNKLVKCCRDGKSMIYSLADEHVVTIIAMGMEHLME